eukprot:TRINITY_DN17196_c0_g1_i1.p1 TRINITY_DN17196_c0_g1~~TRINITY_DN17196_c0_g1_i1.p1  ORF type:complete len:197 (+),score=26.61 TRINITY_DN17196_c0_g1_i1:139-729(+)
MLSTSATGGMSDVLSDDGGGRVGSEASDMLPLLEHDDHKYSSHDLTERDCLIHRGEVPTIECVFVVKFHNNTGNVLEWSMKSDGLLIDDLADKAIVSGFHKIDEDYVYFKHGPHFGMACFHKRMTDNPMKECSYAFCWDPHTVLYFTECTFAFLAERARRLNAENADSDQVTVELEQMLTKWNKVDTDKKNFHLEY